MAKFNSYQAILTVSMCHPGATSNMGAGRLGSASFNWSRAELHELFLHSAECHEKQTNTHTQQNRRHEAQRRDASCVGWGKSLHTEHKWAAELSTRWEQTGSTFLPENPASPDHALLQRTLTGCPLASGPLHQSGCQHWTDRINIKHSQSSY